MGHTQLLACPHGNGPDEYGAHAVHECAISIWTIGVRAIHDCTCDLDLGPEVPPDRHLLSLLSSLASWWLPSWTCSALVIRGNLCTASGSAGLSGGGHCCSCSGNQPSRCFIHGCAGWCLLRDQGCGRAGMGWLLDWGSSLQGVSFSCSFSSHVHSKELSKYCFPKYNTVIQINKSS